MVEKNKSDIGKKTKAAVSAAAKLMTQYGNLHLTPQQRRERASKAGLESARNLTPQQRRERARKAGSAKGKKKKKTSA